MPIIFNTISNSSTVSSRRNFFRHQRESQFKQLLAVPQNHSQRNQRKFFIRQLLAVAPHQINHKKRKCFAGNVRTNFMHCEQFLVSETQTMNAIFPSMSVLKLFPAATTDLTFPHNAIYSTVGVFTPTSCSINYTTIEAAASSNTPALFFLPPAYDRRNYFPQRPQFTSVGITSLETSVIITQ